MLRRVRHRKTEGIYWVLGVAELQSSGGPIREGALVTLYRGQSSRIWARPTQEFEDGRFEEMPAESGSTEPSRFAELLPLKVSVPAMYSLRVDGRPGYVMAADRITPALFDVIVERNRQIDGEGFTSEHDDEHTQGEIARAAACYAISSFLDPIMRGSNLWLGILQQIWPVTWDWSWWKPNPASKRADLVKAGALIIAEIERLDRAAVK